MHAPILTALSLLSVAASSLAAPVLSPPPSSPSPTPFVGAPIGPFFKSTDEVTCEPLRVTYGGGSGPAYLINVVNASSLSSPNQDLESVEVIARVGIMGIPGMTWWSVDDSALEIGDEVALQIMDGMGAVGYSVTRKVVAGRPNEVCAYPGQFWPPSRWDSSHFILILLFFFLGIPFLLGFLSGFKGEFLKHRDVLQRPFSRLAGRSSDANADGAVQLEETMRRMEEGEEGRSAHVLGESEERSSEEEEDRPLLDQGGEPSTLPPGYEEATKDHREGE
ncbi:hypothetical protein JCM1841_004160 [Sporobolomyces salmonicolor]